jgi:phosphotransacetylase
VNAKPLRILLADNIAPEEYTKQSAKEAFQKLKEKLCTPPILCASDLKIPFRMYTNASKDGYSCILAKVDKEKKEYVVAYYSRATTEGKSKRHSTELEFGAVN